MERKEIDLYTLSKILKGGIESIFPDSVWVKAEISSLKLRANGHCYMDLCQSENGRLLAKFSAVIWGSRYKLLSSYFENQTKSKLMEGIQVLVEVQVNYSELYGLSLIINNIDPEFSLGQKEAQRQKSIDDLTRLGYMEKQKKLQLKTLPYNILIISAQNAAGLRDFTVHIKENEYGFRYDFSLAEAIMQGKDSPGSISDILESILPGSFDAVLIIRGGGSNLDLSCYDDYDLAVKIADCPVPVLTAVGHDQDYHICDMVSYKNFKTPTALADFLIEIYADEDAMITSYANRLKLGFLNKVLRMSAMVDLLESKILSADPRKIISRGYILALDQKGRVITSAKSLNQGDIVRLMMKDGNIVSRVCNVEHKEL